MTAFSIHYGQTFFFLQWMNLQEGVVVEGEEWLACQESIEGRSPHKFIFLLLSSSFGNSLLKIMILMSVRWFTLKACSDHKRTLKQNIPILSQGKCDWIWWYRINRLKTWKSKWISWVNINESSLRGTEIGLKTHHIHC